MFQPSFFLEAGLHAAFHRQHCFQFLALNHHRGPVVYQLSFAELSSQVASSDRGG